MTLLRAGDATFDVEAVVFDKDGTLVDLDASWSAAGRTWIEVAAAGDAAVAADLAFAVGYDPLTVTLVPDGALAAGTVHDIGDIMAGVLAAHGVADAGSRLIAGRDRALVEAANPAHMVALGDVASCWRMLAGAGLALAVLTSDDRAVAEATLRALGVAEMVTVVVGGDDPFPPKPDPAGLLHIARTLGVDSSRLVMVGDSTADMGAGRAAGVAGLIAVGAGSPAAALADVVVASIDGLGV